MLFLFILFFPGLSKHWILSTFKGTQVLARMCWLCGLGRRGSRPLFPTSPLQPQQDGVETMAAPGPYAGVDSYLRGLAGAAEGFGHSSIGGLNGRIYHVTSLAGGCTLLCDLEKLSVFHVLPLCEQLHMDTFCL